MHRYRALRASRSASATAANGACLAPEALYPACSIQRTQRRRRTLRKALEKSEQDTCLGSVLIQATVAKGANRAQCKARPTRLGRSPTRRKQRRNAPDSPPSLRVAPQSGVCGVVGLGNGTTIACTLRLASIRIGTQRDPPTEGEQTLESRRGARGNRTGWRRLLTLSARIDQAVDLATSASRTPSARVCRDDCCRKRVPPAIAAARAPSPGLPQASTGEFATLQRAGCRPLRAAMGRQQRRRHASVLAPGSPVTTVARAQRIADPPSPQRLRKQYTEYSL